jgi:hypothetical protein
MMKHLLFSTLAILLALSSPTHAQDKPKWDVSNPALGGVPYRDVEFTTDEGTWMSLDVSPNGKTIVFDMLDKDWLGKYSRVSRLTAKKSPLRAMQAVATISGLWILMVGTLNK